MYAKYILVVVLVWVVDSDAGGHGESHHDHINLHVPEFIHHDHHTKVITIHHHHHKPKEHHHHHHHHKPIIPHGPPKFHYNHHHSKSSSHTTSKGHTNVGKKSHGNLGPKGKHVHHKHGHSGHHSHSGHDHGYKHHDVPSYDPPSYDPPNYELPKINYSPPVLNYSPSPSYGSDYSSFTPSIPNIPSPQVHGVIHTVQQVKVFDSLPGPLKTGSSGYQVTEQNENGEEDVFTSVNSLSQTYPGAFEHLRNAAEQNDYSDIIHANSNNSPNTNPFTNAQQQNYYANINDFTSQNQVQAIPNEEAYPEMTGYDNVGNTAVGNDLSGATVLSLAETVQDDTPVSFSSEAGVQHAINSGGVETIAY